MMNETLMWVIALVSGVLLGAFFFGGLWWTIQRGLTAQRPVVWFLGSAVVRTTLVLLGFYVLADGHWQRLVFGLLGFALSRPVVNGWTRSRATKPDSRHENTHAS